MPHAFKRPAKTLWWVVGGARTNSELPQAGFPCALYRGKYCAHDTDTLYFYTVCVYASGAGRPHLQLLVNITQSIDSRHISQHDATQFAFCRP